MEKITIKWRKDIVYFNTLQIKMRIKVLFFLLCAFIFPQHFEITFKPLNMIFTSVQVGEVFNVVICNTLDINSS